MAKARLMMDFEEVGDLARFVAEMKRLELLPDSAGVYECESLDFSKGTGVTRKYTYVLQGDDSEGRKRLMVSTELPI